MDCPIEATLIEMTHNWPEDSQSSSPTRSSPSSTSTIAPTETGLSAKVEAPRDSRTYMCARFRSVMIPVREPSSSTIGSWLMFRLAIARPTLRSGSFLRATATSPAMTSFTRSMMCSSRPGFSAPLFFKAHPVCAFTSPSRAAT
jgi:hypothetical protein